MVFERETIRTVEQFTPKAWEGVVFRHMFADYPPERENRGGARWNPPGTPAIYTSLLRETAIAEADYYISLQPIRPSARRRVYQIEVKLDSVLDLADWETLARFGLQADALDSIDHTDCQQIGGAVAWMEHDGLLVPSARADGVNLVIFPNGRKPRDSFEVVGSEELPAGD